MIGLLLALAAADISNCDGAQSEMNFCGKGIYQRADRRMNEQWRKTLTTLRRVDKENAKSHLGFGPAADSLLKGQRAWLVYRNQSCESVRRIDPGSIAPLNYFACLASMTESRTRELHALTINPNSDEPL